MSRQHTIRVKSFQGMFRVFIHVTEADGRQFGGRIITQTGNQEAAMKAAETASVTHRIPMFKATF